MTKAVLELRAGSTLWFDGGSWTVCEVTGSSVRLLGREDVTGRHPSRIC